MAKIITITSGKGGVGKTSISLNLSLSLASQGFKVCLLDADLGLANVSILTGIYPEKDLESVITGESSLKDIIIKDYQGIDIIPGSSGVEKIADLSQEQTGRLISAFLELEAYDYFIFDTSAGISSQVLSFCMASHEIILVATTEPTSLTDAYAMLKVLSKYKYHGPVKVVINQVKSGKLAKAAYTRLKGTVKKFLSINIEPLGIVASDKHVRSAVVAQTPFYMLHPDCVASRCIQAITGKLNHRSGQANDIPMEMFWDKCLTFIETYKNDGKKLEPEVKEKEPKRVEKNDPAEQSKTDKQNNIEEQTDPLRDAIFQINDSLSLLVQEVGEIKKILANQTPKPENIEKESDSLPSPKKISLDFESWLAKQYKA